MTKRLEYTNITSAMEKGRREETISRIKESAIVEFLEKGYGKTNLRSICQKADVTTGAFYFSFSSKEALLDAILEPLVNRYENMIIELREVQIAHPEQGVDIDKKVMGFLMQYRREALIILEKCEGSKYGGYRETVKNMMLESFSMYFMNALGWCPDRNLMKILVSERLQGCIDIIKGDYDMKYAMYLVEKTGIFAEGGTESLIESLKKESGK